MTPPTRPPRTRASQRAPPRRVTPARTASDGKDDKDGEPVWPRRRGKVREHERTYGPRGRRKHLVLDPAHVTDEHRHLRPDATRCRCCGEALTEIGEETSTRIEREPTRFRRVITHRHKMACSSCRQGGVTIARPDDPPTFGAGMVGTSLAVDLVLMHYDDHLPFHRMARILRRDGLTVDRSTLSRVCGRVAHVLAPIVATMASELLASDLVLGIDGTPVKVLAQGRTARGARSTSSTTRRTSSSGPWCTATPRRCSTASSCSAAS
jgi:transposase